VALNAKAKRSDKIATKPLPNDQRSAIGMDYLAALTSRVGDRLPPGRKRTIMARYVFGDELKPGERWKRGCSRRDEVGGRSPIRRIASRRH
jgi:hypothetical protein